MRGGGPWFLVLVACTPSGLGTVGDVESEGEQTSVFCWPGPRKLDVLFVVDDSSSMADEAARVASAARGFANVLTAPDQDFDVRVAVTRTAPRDCDGELGALLDTSCLQRSDAFVTTAESDGAAPVDLRTAGCAAECSMQSFGLLPPPSLVDPDDASAGPPWLAEVRGQPSGLSRAPLADALACLLPVGIGGCEQESPLAAMLAAIDRSLDASDPAYGWMRDDAALFTVVITDEDEADPELPLVAAARLRELLAFKQALDPELRVMLGLVAGWDDGEAEPIPSGCTSYEQSATPPLRLDVLRQAATDSMVEISSICGTDFATVLDPATIASRDQIRPLCIEHCVAFDEDETPQCTAQLREGSGADQVVEPVAPCVPDDLERWRVPDGADRCVVFSHEDIAEFCLDRGSNVEVQLLVGEGSPLGGPSCIEVTCAQAEDPHTTCPSLR